MSHLVVHLVFALLYSSSVVYGSLLFTQVWFRHGQRAPTKFLRMPAEPAEFGKDFPVMAGELTKPGKTMEYTLGERLRQYYDGFLPSLLNSHQIRILFDEDNRTSTSAQLMLAGLYPPSGDEMWNANIAWQPVPLHEEQILKHVSLGMMDPCSVAAQRIGSSQGYTDVLARADQEFVADISRLSGVSFSNINGLNDVVDSYVTRYRINDSRLAVPEWMDPAMYDRLDNLTNYLHRSFMDLTKKESGGWHIGRVLSEFEGHLGRPADVKNKAVFFSGHDTNLMTLGRELDLDGVGGHLPGYGSHLALELHNSTGDLTVEIFFSSNFSSQRERKTIPSCGQPCLYSNFVKAFKGSSFSSEQWWNFCSGWGPLEKTTSPAIAWMIVVIIVLLLVNIFLLYKCLAARKALRNPERTPLMN